MRLINSVEPIRFHEWAGVGQYNDETRGKDLKEDRTIFANALTASAIQFGLYYNRCGVLALFPTTLLENM